MRSLGLTPVGSFVPIHLNFSLAFRTFRRLTPRANTLHDSSPQEFLLKLILSLFRCTLHYISIYTSVYDPVSALLSLLLHCGQLVLPPDEHSTINRTQKQYPRSIRLNIIYRFQVLRPPVSGTGISPCAPCRLKRYPAPCCSDFTIRPRIFHWQFCVRRKPFQTFAFNCRQA